MEDGETDEEKELAEAKGNELLAPRCRRSICGDFQWTSLFSRTLVHHMVSFREIIPFYGQKIQVSEILKFTHIYIYIYTQGYNISSKFHFTPLFCWNPSDKIPDTTPSVLASITCFQLRFTYDCITQKFHFESSFSRIKRQKPIVFTVRYWTWP